MMQSSQWRGGMGGPGPAWGLAPPMGLCFVHRCNRPRVDLMPIPGQNGALRCRPLRECTARAPGSILRVMCHVHHRIRHASEVTEVQQDVFECLPHCSCLNMQDQPVVRVGGTGPAATGGIGAGAALDAGAGDGPGVSVGVGAVRGMVRPAVAPFAKKATGRRRLVGGQREVPMSWAPTMVGVGLAADKARLRLRTGLGVGEKEVKVWCARHGKQLPKGMCEFVDECFYVCLDSASCLSTPLETPAALKGKGCTELLCSEHSTIRLVAFLDRSDDNFGYNCSQKHRCRGVTTAAFLQRNIADGEQAQVEETELYYTNDASSAFFV